MDISTGDIVQIRQDGEMEPEFIRGRVLDVLPGVNNEDWRGFYYRVLDEAGREDGPRLFAYDYSVALVETP